MISISKETLNQLREMYPKGSRVVLIEMRDYAAPPEGTEGTVNMVDDIGTIHVKWGNGRELGAVYGVDTIKLVKG